MRRDGACAPYGQKSTRSIWQSSLTQQRALYRKSWTKRSIGLRRSTQVTRSTFTPDLCFTYDQSFCSHQALYSLSILSLQACCLLEYSNVFRSRGSCMLLLAAKYDNPTAEAWWSTFSTKPSGFDSASFFHWGYRPSINVVIKATQLDRQGFESANQIT